MAETIRQLANQTEAGATPLAIAYPEPAQGFTGNFELKSGFLHHLPKFHGLNNEDPNKHLKQFEFVCGSMCPQGANLNILRMKAFPFTLEDRSQTWLFDLPAGTINTWQKMRREFLTKYFPASKVTVLRKQISGIQQAVDEIFSSYFERYKTLVGSCPNHGMKDENLLTFFYEGLRPLERDLLDAAAGGSFMDKTPDVAKELLANRALNHQQYEATTNRRVNEVSSNSILEEKVNNMSTLLSQVLKSQGGVVAQICGVCSTEGHPTDQCPQLIANGGWESVNAVGYQGNQGGQKYNPFSNTYNPGFKDHPNFRWSNNQNVLNPPVQGQGFQPRPPGLFMRPQVPQNFNQGSSSNNNSANPNFDDILKSLAQGQQTLSTATQALVSGQQTHTKDIDELKKQMGQVVEFMGQIRESGKLPSNTTINPNQEHAKAVTTRGGKVLVDVSKAPKKTEVIHLDENVETSKNALEKDPATSRAEANMPQSSDKGKGILLQSSEFIKTDKKATCPFPSRFW